MRSLRKRLLTIAPAMVGAILLASWGGLLLLLTIAKRPDWLPSPQGIAIEHLGQFGDAFAPVTALFALVAAVGAWHSYEAQRQQLEDERERNRTQRFDELFFRLLDYYDNSLHSIPAGNVTTLAWIGMLKNDFDYPAPGDDSVRDAERWHRDLNSRGAHYGPLQPLSAQIPAIVRWLRSTRTDHIGDYASLLDAHLGDDERWFWQCAIASTTDVELIKFAGELRIFQLGRGMTIEDALAFRYFAREE